MRSPAPTERQRFSETRVFHFWSAWSCPRPCFHRALRSPSVYGQPRAPERWPERPRRRTLINRAENNSSPIYVYIYIYILARLCSVATGAHQRVQDASCRFGPPPNLRSWLACVRSLLVLTSESRMLPGFTKHSESPRRGRG